MEASLEPVGHAPGIHHGEYIMIYAEYAQLFSACLFPTSFARSNHRDYVLEAQYVLNAMAKAGADTHAQFVPPPPLNRQRQYHPLPIIIREPKDQFPRDQLARTTPKEV
jgi:hypothetical protein